MCQVLSQLNNRTENYPCLTHMQRSQLNCFLHVKFTDTNWQPCVLHTSTWMSDLTLNFDANLDHFEAKSDTPGLNLVYYLPCLPLSLSDQANELILVSFFIIIKKEMLEKWVPMGTLK